MGELTLLMRMRYMKQDVRDAWHTRRHFGWLYMFRTFRLVGSFVFGYRVRCFTCKRRIAAWDPIVGAYCYEPPCRSALPLHGNGVVETL